MTLLKDPRVKADSRRTEATHRREVHTPRPRAPMGPAGGAVMLCAAVVLLAAQMSMFPNTRLGEENATFMVAPCAALALGGLNAIGRPAQSHRIAGLLGLVAGTAVVLVGLANPHEVAGTQVVQLVCGLAGMLGAAPLLAAR